VDEYGGGGRGLRLWGKADEKVYEYGGR